MSHRIRVMKFGGGCLKDAAHLAQAVRIAVDAEGPLAVVVSAVSGMTDRLLGLMTGNRVDSSKATATLAALRTKHLELVDWSVRSQAVRRDVVNALEATLCELEWLLWSAAASAAIGPATRSSVASYGERLAARLVAGVFLDRGRHAVAMDADAVGIVTTGVSADTPSVDLPRTSVNLRRRVVPVIERGGVPIITGYFGRTPGGEVVTFGRNASDYSAAVVAAALEAPALEIWKDVDGFMSADPRIVPSARHIPVLSFKEAAEFGQFGARILHPRTLQPIARGRTSVTIKSLFDPEAPGTRLTPICEQARGDVKGVGCRTGVLVVHLLGPRTRSVSRPINEIHRALAAENPVPAAVIVSCDALAVVASLNDCGRGLRVAKRLLPFGCDRVEVTDAAAVVAVVGSGVAGDPSAATRTLGAVARAGVPVRVAAGTTSGAAFAVVVDEPHAHQALHAVHSEFFGTPVSHRADR